MEKIIKFSSVKSINFDEIKAILNIKSFLQKSHLSVVVNSDGKRKELIPPEANIIVCEASQFHVHKAIRNILIKKFGIENILRILGQFKQSKKYSEHICNKVITFIESGEVYFKYEAQFAPDAVRRTEKNVYFATTFSMIITNMFIELFSKNTLKNEEKEILMIFENAERIDRCSLRLLQNILLRDKVIKISLFFYFKTKEDNNIEIKSKLLQYFTDSRKLIFNKFFNVGMVVGCMDFVDINEIIERIDFIDSFQKYYNKELRINYDDNSLIKEMSDSIYKSNYEKFYALSKIEAEKKILSLKNIKVFHRFLILACCYNYLFDDAISECRIFLEYDSKSITYAKLMEGLIVLKKKKDNLDAKRIFLEGLSEIENIENIYEKTVEESFLLNAINFADLLDCMANNRLSDIDIIIEKEHEILQKIIKIFLQAPKSHIYDSKELTNIMFIMTTLVENITKSNKIVDRNFDNIDLYLSYEYILEVVGQRMVKEEYHKSFSISFSHALIHTKMAIASGYYSLGNFQDAYDITKSLLDVVDKYDVTGNYKAYILNAHAIYCEKLNKLDESVCSLKNMAIFYYAYNENYMVKLAINKIKNLLSDHESNVFIELNDNNIIDSKLKFPEESYLIANATLDLENNLLAGLEQKVFTLREMDILTENKEIDALKSAYRVYEHWKQ